MEEGREITREMYVTQKLSKEIADLKQQIANLEFNILVLQEKNLKEKDGGGEI